MAQKPKVTGTWRSHQVPVSGVRDNPDHLATMTEIDGGNVMTKRIRTYLLAALAGGVAVIGLTLLIYATFFQDYLEQFQTLSPDVLDLIEKDDPVLVTTALANLAHGFLIATVIYWGKFYKPLRGAGAAAAIAFMTEVYFLFTQYSLFKTIGFTEVILDTLMWTFINAIVGALVAWIFGRSANKDGQDRGVAPTSRTARANRR